MTPNLTQMPIDYDAVSREGMRLLQESSFKPAQGCLKDTEPLLGRSVPKAVFNAPQTHPNAQFNPGSMTVLPADSAERKKYPLFSGCLHYFPNALALVARRSWEGSNQHHPGQPLHWDPSKSSDELDALTRHITEGEWDAVAWRALAHLERMVAAGYNPHNHALDPDP